MSIDRAREALARYIKSNHSDLSMMAPDVVFTNMATGDEHRGVEALAGMLHYVYHVAFDAHAETRNLIVSDGHAVLEGLKTSGIAVHRTEASWSQTEPGSMPLVLTHTARG